MGGRGKISFRRFAGKIKGWSTVLLYLWMFLLSVLLILISVMGVTRNAVIPSTKPGSIPALANSVALTDKPKLFYLHYIRFKPVNSTGVPLRFTEYLSVLSGVQRLKPDVILIHGDEEPTGKRRLQIVSAVQDGSETDFWGHASLVGRSAENLALWGPIKKNELRCLGTTLVTTEDLAPWDATLRGTI